MTVKNRDAFLFGKENKQSSIYARRGACPLLKMGKSLAKVTPPGLGGSMASGLRTRLGIRAAGLETWLSLFPAGPFTLQASGTRLGLQDWGPSLPPRVIEEIQ